MTDAAVPPKKASKLPLLLGILLAVLGAAGGYVLTSGMLSSGDSAPAAAADSHAAPSDAHAVAASTIVDGITFVPMEPLFVSLAGEGERVLRFRGELEVAPPAVAEVTALMPRIIDVMNVYLRAVRLADLENPDMLFLLRAHLLHRIALVVGEGKVNDLLIMEFVLN